MNSAQRRRLLRLAARARQGHPPSARQLASLPRDMGAGVRLALVEDAGLELISGIDSAVDVSNITKSQEGE
jgi:hypothetical protein